MTILTLRTDKPDAELGVYEDQQQLAYRTWLAHRQLAESIHQVINTILGDANSQLKAIGGVVIYKGPGSFTGLRIGASVANALAASLEVPIVGLSGEDWQTAGIAKLLAGDNDHVVIPEYGSLPHITQPKH